MDISPDKQNIDGVFSNTMYHIDFYQRNYRWTHEPVKRLLDDLFYKFTDQYERSKDLEPSQETIAARYPWYYLNTYVTNIIEGRVYVVDGQQRLTTLSLILIKLRHMAKAMDSRLLGWIDSRIVSHSGYDEVFWMNHVKHTPTQQALFSGEPVEDVQAETGITAQNMVQNYQTISDRLNTALEDQHQIETFVFYFLQRVVLINLKVEQTDVPMVFEVINDRGVRLRSYEILKGKLLGQIDKLELDQGAYNDLWDDQASAINDYREDEFDQFFRFFLKAKFAGTRREGQRFDGDYHRIMFSNDVSGNLRLDHNPPAVKKFLKDEFTYYGYLYGKLLGAYETRDSQFPDVYYNYLLNLDAPFLLGLSVCHLNDSQEEEKIKTVTREIDRYFSLLQLQNAYDSNDFADSLYTISESIRDVAPESYRSVFDSKLSQAIGQRRNAPNADPLSYAAFKQTGINLNMRFKRYFFARIDEFLAKNMNMSPKHPLGNLVTKTGPKTGFHSEHILSNNKENLALFGNDEELFEQERNRLGGILLLKGQDNISSGNEPFQEKLRSYANTLYWNETLRQDTYKSKLDMKSLRDQFNLNLRPLDHFGPEELESRHRLLFEMVRIMWN